MAVPIPPDRPTLGTVDFVNLLAAQGVKTSDRTIQRHAAAGAFTDRYPGWLATRGDRGQWLISPSP